jgi:hypothetical protein
MHLQLHPLVLQFFIHISVVLVTLSRKEQLSALMIFIPRFSFLFKNSVIIFYTFPIYMIFF